MQIRPVDVFDDALFARYFAIIDAAEQFGRPLATRWSLREAEIDFRTPDAAERVEAWAAFDGEEMVGALYQFFPLLDNTDMTWLQVCVEPQRRRRGIGSALIDAAVARARDEGRHTLLAQAALPFEERETHGYLGFALKNGFAIGNMEIHRVLDLPVDEAVLRALVDEASVHHAAYRIERFVDGLPAELLPSYCRLSNQLGLDAPTGDIDFEAEAITPQIWLERLDVMRRQGSRRSTTVAVAASGEVVAYSDLIIPAEDRPNIRQWGTLVHREHRGHRLGLAVKARNLLEVQREHPDRRMVHTGNAEVNQNMIDINDRLGFRAVEVLPEFQRKLEPAEVRLQAAG